MKLLNFLLWGFVLIFFIALVLAGIAGVLYILYLLPTVWHSV